jgi:phosphoesterase RecJ-like protein
MPQFPITNASLKEIANALDEAQNVCICGHVSPDGDCLGSALALRLALLQRGKNVACLLAGNSALERGLMFLPGFDTLQFAGDFDGECDTFVCVDVPSESRLGEYATDLKNKAKTTITIDHHATPAPMSMLNYIEPESPSNSMIIWRLVNLMDVDITPDVATCTLTGLITDTGRFAHSNTTPGAFEAAAEMMHAGANSNYITEQVFQNRSLASLELEAIAIEHMRLTCSNQVALSYISSDDMRQVGAIKADCEPLIDMLRSISGVKLCCMLRDEGTHIRGSFRAKDDTDMAALARRFDGGGHRAAAGFTLYVPLDEAISLISKTLEEALGGNN